ncbi:MAG: hypothetical protein QOE77_1924 [Blastocatellia bacterium]|nr:hypothetical protein [Blastocatellia bacterium]
MLGLVLAMACHSREHQQMRVIVPHASWEPIFFRAINAAANLSGQTNLRTKQLPEDDIEVRIWWGFGLSQLEGVTLRRSSGQWSGIHVKGDHYYELTRADRTQLSDPKSGWETIWPRMVSAGMLSLPDASEIDCEVVMLDGGSYVVETNANNTYRTYKYAISDRPKCKEATSMMEIADIIFEEFGPQIFPDGPVR